MNGSNGKSADHTLRNHIAIVLDESGSMMSIRREIMDAFNEQVEVIRASAEDQPTTISLVTFSTSVPDPTYWAQPVDIMRPLRDVDYRPSGLTAMLDAMGLTMDRLRALPDADDENTSFLVMVLSDGRENNSRQYSDRDIAERIQALERTDRWTFAYIGANQDLAEVSDRLHIPAENMMVFAPTPDGVRYGGNVVRDSTEAWVGKRRAGLKSDKSFFGADGADPTPRPPDQPGAFWR